MDNASFFSILIAYTCTSNDVEKWKKKPITYSSLVENDKDYKCFTESLMRSWIRIEIGVTLYENM